MTHDRTVAEEIMERREREAHDRHVAAANAASYAARLSGAVVEMPGPYIPVDSPRTVPIRPEPTTATPIVF